MLNRVSLNSVPAHWRRGGAPSRLKILILKPSSLGDVVHALPVLRLLKLHRPDSEIYWWLESSLVPLLADDPDIAGIFSFERKSWAAPSTWPQLADCMRRMRRKRFNLAIDLQGLFRSGLFAWLANSDLTIGLDNPREGAREGARIYYDLLTPRAPAGMHAVDRYLAVLPQLGVPVHQKFQWIPERPHVAASVREKWKPDSVRWIALLPGARWNNKRWPVENFAELVRQLSAVEPDCKFAILGGGADCALGKTVAEAAPSRCLDLTGRTSLLEMTEWLRLSELVITNDTGPMHIAAALRKPIVALFGPTDPNATGPYGQQERALRTSGLSCAPCMKSSCSYPEPLACLRALTPAMVCQQAQKRMREVCSSCV